MLATWLSYPDFSRLMERCVVTPHVGCAVIWGASNNARMTWWRDDARGALGWAPVDSADPFAGQLAGPGQRRSGGGTLHGRSILLDGILARRASAGGLFGESDD